MTNCADPGQSVGFFRSQLIWIYIVSKGRVYPGSADQGLRGLDILGRVFANFHKGDNIFDFLFTF